MEEQYVVTRIREFVARHLDGATDPGTRRRARDIPLLSITLLQVEEYFLHAQVVGTQPYLVRIDVDPVHVYASCTCPVPHHWCKHVVAVMLHIDELAPTRDPLVSAALATMTAAELMALLTELRTQFPQAEPLLARLALPGWFDMDYPGGVERGVEVVHDARTEHTARAWRTALDTIRFQTHPDQNPSGHELPRMVAVIQQAIGFLALEVGAKLGDATFTALINDFLELHREVVGEAHAPCELIADFFVDLYYSPVLPDPQLEEYEHLLGDTGLSAVLAAAAERGTTGLRQEQYANVAVDVELLRGNWREAELLATMLPVQDKLFSFFDDAEHAPKCEELLRRALDDADPTQLSPTLIEQHATQYLDPATVRNVFREWFLAAPSIDTFALYLGAPGQTYDEAMTTLALLDKPAPSFMLMAAVDFERYDEGWFVIENFEVDSMVAATWAVSVELPRDPVTAVRRLFAYFRLWLSAASDMGTGQPDSAEAAAHVALRIAQLRALLLDLEDQQLAAKGLAQWAGQLALFKAEYRQRPYLWSALAEYQL